MLRSAPRPLLLRSLKRPSRVIAINRPTLPICRRYADKKSPFDNDTPPPVSNYIASQTHPSNSETPPDRMPRQTEDIATEKIFGAESSTGNSDGLPAEGIPVENVFNKSPEAMQNAPEAIKNDPTGASGAGNSLPGKEIPATVVPIEEIIGDGDRLAVMGESLKNDNEPSATGQALRTDDQNPCSATTGTEQSTDSDNSTQATRKSILDLFGPEKTRKRKSQTPKPISEPKVNPLLRHKLDGSNTDLSDWETARGSEQPTSTQDINPDDWAGLQRGSYESEDMTPHPEPRKTTSFESELSKEIRENYINIPKPKIRGKRNVDLDKDYSIPEPIPPSAWDYFYPPQPPPKPLSSSVHSELESQKRTAQSNVYDPFARTTKQAQWPFMYNRDKFVELCTNYLMRDGKKATAEKVLQQVFLRILEHYPRRHPVTLLAEALDRNAPLLKNVNVKDSSLRVTIVPQPLFEKQRIRVGWMSLINAASKSREHGLPFPDRLAKEVIKVMEGRGAGLPFRIAEHKKAMGHKLNVKLPKKIK